MRLLKELPKRKRGNMAIRKCSCKSEYQDSKYGKGQRVHNRGVSKINNDKPAWVCTVCGKRED